MMHRIEIQDNGDIILNEILNIVDGTVYYKVTNLSRDGYDFDSDCPELVFFRDTRPLNKFFRKLYEI